MSNSRWTEGVRRPSGAESMSELEQPLCDVVAFHSPFSVLCFLFTSWGALTYRLTPMRVRLPHRQGAPEPGKNCSGSERARCPILDRSRCPCLYRVLCGKKYAVALPRLSGRGTARRYPAPGPRGPGGPGGEHWLAPASRAPAPSPVVASEGAVLPIPLPATWPSSWTATAAGRGPGVAEDPRPPAGSRIGPGGHPGVRPAGDRGPHPLRLQRRQLAPSQAGGGIPDGPPRAVPRGGAAGDPGELDPAAGDRGGRGPPARVRRELEESIERSRGTPVSSSPSP